MLTALFVVLLLAALVITFVGYVTTYQLQESSLPFSVPVCRLAGQLPLGVKVVAADLEQLGYVVESPWPGQYRIRPLNRYEQKEKKGTSADPFDMSSSARLVVEGANWRLEVRKAPGVGLVVGVIAFWLLLSQKGEALSLVWALFVVATLWHEWTYAGWIYERLGGQLSRLGVCGAAQQPEANKGTTSHLEQRLPPNP